MAKGWVGIDNIANTVASMFIGINGKARKIKYGYIGVNGKARKFYPIIPKPVISGGGTYTYDGNEKKFTVSNLDISSVNIDGVYNATNVGTYSLTISLKNQDDVWDDGTKDPVSSVIKITPLVITIPTVTNTSKTYNGSNQSPTISNYDSNHVNVSGNTASSAGSYTVLFELKDTVNYQWTDGTNTQKTASWYIAKATTSITSSIGTTYNLPFKSEVTFSVKTYYGGKEYTYVNYSVDSSQTATSVQIYKNSSTSYRVYNGHSGSSSSVFKFTFNGNSNLNGSSISITFNG